MDKQIKFTNPQGEEVIAEYSEELANEMLLVGIDIEQEIIDGISKVHPDVVLTVHKDKK